MVLLVVAAAIAVVVTGTVAVLNVISSKSVVTPGCAVTGAAGRQYTLSFDQAQNAAIIAAVAYRDQMPDHAVTVALAVSMEEAGLQNLPYGDRDSLGLFQQRPSQGWGTPAQLLDPQYAASAFYGRLAEVQGWQAMPVTEAAQAVQLSADPGAYAAWEDEARALAVALTGEVAGGFSCRLNGFRGAAPGPAALGQALASETGAHLLEVPVSSKVGWQIASWVVAHAYNYHVENVSFAGKTWRSDSGKWTPDAAHLDPQEVTVSTGSTA
jgi:hypothetical protein